MGNIREFTSFTVGLFLLFCILFGLLDKYMFEGRRGTIDVADHVLKLVLIYFNCWR